jgi:hypothetical protein
MFSNNKFELSFRIPEKAGNYSIKSKHECDGQSYFALIDHSNNKIFKSNDGDNNVITSGTSTSDGKGNYSFDLVLKDASEVTGTTIKVKGTCYYPIN